MANDLLSVCGHFSDEAHGDNTHPPTPTLLTPISYHTIEDFCLPKGRRNEIHRVGVGVMK